MIINGRVRQACSALVDKLLADRPHEIELQPMSKFPVIRDLSVDRRRLFRALEKVKAWLPVDGYYDMGPGPRQSQDDQQLAYPLSECMSCGCCLDACPQYAHVEVARRAGETDAEYKTRASAAYDVHFVGAHAISQVMYYNSHPTGKLNAGERLDALMAPGGIQICGNAQNCVAVCPKKIPLTTSIGRAGRATTKRMFAKWFDR
jgi:succinate dehydrogenase / fumarate reductase iron-sulfur subunit